jgi:phosphomannomutase
MSGSEGARAPLMDSVSGRRGIVGASLTPGAIAAYAGAWAAHVRESLGVERPVMTLGRDGRRGGEALARIAGGALAAAGCDVIDLGVAMTPSVGVMTLGHDAHGGLVMTASHNPGEWNGLKPITRLGGAPSPGEARALLERVRSGEPAWVDAARVGTIRTDPSANDAHVGRVLEAVGRLTPIDLVRDRKFEVVVDSVNASGARAAALLLARLGCDVTHLHNEPTGVFPHTPEPIGENLGELCEAMERSGAAVGFAQDPDGDRLAIVDRDGRFIGEEQTLALCARSYLASLPAERAARQTLAANLSTSRMIDDVAARFEARVVRTPVGEANVVAAMREHGCAIGGEGNGGVILSEVVPIRDSLISMALVLALMAREGASVSALVEEMPAYAIEKRKLPIEPGMTERVVSKLRGLFPGAAVDEQDGIRLDFETPSGGGMAWLHARPSNTEPIFRLIAEAPTKQDASAILDKAMG